MKCGFTGLVTPSASFTASRLRVLGRPQPLESQSLAATQTLQVVPNNLTLKKGGTFDWNSLAARQLSLLVVLEGVVLGIPNKCAPTTDVSLKLVEL